MLHFNSNIGEIISAHSCKIIDDTGRFHLEAITYSKGSEGHFGKFIFKGTNLNNKEQEWCSGESSNFPPVWPGFDCETQ